MPAPVQNRRGAWFALSVLFAINMLNFYDRQIGGAVNEPVAKEWGLNFDQLGNLATAFTLIYAIVGVPLARLADRTSRTRILSIGVAVWSVLTAVSGMTWSYGSMFVTRLGVGVGEASCAPAANSLVGDLFPPRQRGACAVDLHARLADRNLLEQRDQRRAHREIRSGELRFTSPAFRDCCAPSAALLIREPARGSSEHGRRALRDGQAAAPASRFAVL